MIQLVKCLADQMLAMCMVQGKYPNGNMVVTHKCSCGGIRESVVLAVHPEICSITVLNTCPSAK